MMQKVLNQKTSVQATEENEKLFKGIWIRWSALTGAERLICANIVLLPVWWIVGIINYMLPLLLLGLVFHDWRRYGKLRFKRPSMVVIAFLAYSLYEYIDRLFIFFNAYPSIDLPSDFVQNPNDLIRATIQLLTVPGLVWYIQSNKVNIRLQVVAWACSVSLIQMLLMWLFLQIFPINFGDTPPRTLYAFLTGKSPIYLEDQSALGMGASNYLIIKDTNEERYRFFFDHYQTCAVFVGFVGLLALDLKNRLWSLFLFIACCFLLQVTGARAVWIAFPPVVFIRFLYLSSKEKGAWLFFALFALISFLSLSFPPVTNLTFNTFKDTKQEIAESRAGSTEARSKVYQQTIKRIPDKIIFGHKVEGERATEGPTVHMWEDAPRIGSHSFILGKLLYQQGIVGTSLFAIFWILLNLWLYKTRASRPLCCLLFPLMLTISAPVSIIHLTMTTNTLLCMMLCKSKPLINSITRTRMKSYA